MDLKTLHHELRTPLTGILGLAELLKQEPLSSEQLSDIQAISACGERLLQFCEVLFSKVHQDTGLNFKEDKLMHKDTRRFFA